MMPVATNTQITIPTQVSFVATPLPGTQALRALPDAVSPTVSDAALGPDYKGNGGYAGMAAPAANSNTPSAPLTVLIPASLSTANASLSAGAMLATQFLSQGPQAGGEFFAVYEELVAASQVKYKPSNATAPEPAPNNLFAKMLAETQTQNNVKIAVQIQQAPKEAVSQAAAPLAAPVPVKQKPATQTSSVAAVRYASHSYQATSARNQAELEAPEPVDTIAG